MQRKAGPGKGEIDDRTNSHRSVGDHQRKFKAIREPGRAALGQGMTGRNNRTKMQIVARDHAQTWAGRKIITQRDIGLTGQHGVRDLIERQDAQANMDAWMRLEHAGNKAGQRAGRKTVHGGDSRLTALQPPQRSICAVTR